MNKNLFLFAAAAALTFTACSDNDDMTASRDGSLSSNETTAVQFSTYLAGQQTRTSGGTTGAIVNGANSVENSLAKLGFGVFAYNTKTDTWASKGTDYTPDFMYNQYVSSTDGTIWTYEPVKYWPNDFATGNVDDKQGTNGEDYNATGSTAGNKLSFFAYAPYVEAMSYTNKGTLTHGTDDAIEASDGQNPAANATEGILGMTFNTTKGAPYIKYQLASTDIKSAVDLLWGQKIKSAYNLADGTTQVLSGNYNVDLTKQAVNEKIGFSFKHALAKLGGNTNNTTNTTVSGEENGKVKIILDIDNQKYDKSTAITGGEKDNTTLVTVKEIKIQDLKSYKDNGGTQYTTVTTEKKYRKRGWFNLSTGEWEAAASDGSDYAEESEINKYSTTIKSDGDGSDQTQLTMNSDIAEPASGTTLVYSSTDKKWTTPAIEGVTTTAKSVYATPSSNGGNSDPGVLMIPDKDVAQPFVVTIDYFVRTADSHLSGGYSQVEQVITNLVDIPAGALASNKVYSLLIHLGLTSVKFEAQVANWEDADGTGTSGTSTDEGNKGDENKKDIYLPSNTLSSTTYLAKAVEIEADAEEATLNLTNTDIQSSEASKVVFKSGDTGLSADEATVTSQAATVTIKGIAKNTTGNAKTYNAILQVEDADGKVLQNIEVTITQKAAE